MFLPIIRQSIHKLITGSLPKPTQIRLLTNETNDEPVNIPNPFERERIQCILCRHEITPDYKNTRLLSQFQSPFTGRIYGRHITGLCRQRQEQVEKEIVKAQNAGLMPCYHKEEAFLNDPKLFDAERPLRPHKY